MKCFDARKLGFIHEVDYCFGFESLDDYYLNYIPDEGNDQKLGYVNFNISGVQPVRQRLSAFCASLLLTSDPKHIGHVLYKSITNSRLKND